MQTAVTRVTGRVLSRASPLVQQWQRRERRRRPRAQTARQLLWQRPERSRLPGPCRVVRTRVTIFYFVLRARVCLWRCARCDGFRGSHTILVTIIESERRDSDTELLPQSCVSNDMRKHMQLAWDPGENAGLCIASATMSASVDGQQRARASRAWTLPSDRPRPGCWHGASPRACTRFVMFSCG